MRFFTNHFSRLANVLTFEGSGWPGASSLNDLWHYFSQLSYFCLAGAQSVPSLGLTDHDTIASDPKMGPRGNGAGGVPCRGSGGGKSFKLVVLELCAPLSSLWRFRLTILTVMRSRVSVFNGCVGSEYSYYNRILSSCLILSVFFFLLPPALCVWLLACVSRTAAWMSW